ncbi:MAG TPA: hypothetical protein VEQ42_03455, partial [Pyrinomonadaceae bacterium]|nr:hypothetical protein [Pyrinomonadaceae bacterium]
MAKANGENPADRHDPGPPDETARAVRFGVGPEEVGFRLDELLARRLRRLSRMRIASLLARGACRVNGGEAHAGFRVNSGDLVELALGEDEGPSSMTPEDVPLEIVYEDDELLVVVKPSGVLVHP